MRARQYDFALYFQAAMVFGLSLSLATPVIEQIGYTVPGFFMRALFTGLYVMVYMAYYLFPAAVVSIPLLIAFLAVLYFRNVTFVVEWVTAISTIPQPSDAHFWPLLILAGITLVLFVVVFKFKYSLLLLFFAGLAVFVPLWYLFVDSAYPAAVFYSACCLMLLSYYNGSKLWKKFLQRDENKEGIIALRRSWLGYTASLLSITVMLTLILPKDLAPVPWYSLQAWVNETFSYLTNLRSSETNGIRGDGGVFGFYSFDSQKDTELGNALWQDETILLEVRGDGGIYLKGSIKDTYTGRLWKKTGVLDAKDSFPAPKEPLLDYLTETEVTIKHKRLRTSSVFSMLYPQDVSSLPGSLRIGQNSTLVMSESIPLHREYTVEGLDLAYSANFAEMEKEEELSSLDQYLDLPPDLPHRVRQLALEVAGERQSYYNRMKSLETYLRHNYNYNRDVPFAGQQRDFVDYFLFDLGEGYCTYFATSLAVMGRVVGVPTRYVSGFSVPAEESRNGVYEVAGTNAHAWVEAYIPGLGWLPFEATPGFRTSAELPLHRDAVENGPDAYEDEEGHAGPINDHGLYDQHIDYPISFTEIESRIRAVDFFAVLSQGLAAVFIAALSGLIVFMVYRLRSIKRMISELEAQDPGRRAVGYYLITLSLLDRIDLGKYPGETPRVYSKRINRWVYFLTLNFREVSEGINLALYSNEAVSPDLADEAEQFFQNIFKHYLSKVGKLTALVEILVKGKHFNEHLNSQYV